jgi:hypothetical protein
MSPFRYFTFSNTIGPAGPIDDLNHLSRFAGHPDFQMETWPILEERRTSITRVLFWMPRKGRTQLRTLLTGSSIGRFADVQTFGTLSSQDLDRVFTVAALPFSVFFETSDPWLLARICSLWSLGATLHTTPESLVGLKEAEQEELGRAVSQIPEGKVWLSFADEGLLMYAFGSDTVIIQATSAQGRVASNLEQSVRSFTPKPKLA